MGAVTDAEAPPPRTNSLGVPISCAECVLPCHRPCMPSLEAMRESPHNPVVVTPDSSVKGVAYNGSHDPAQQLPINGPGIEFESDVFKGRVMVHIRNLPSTIESLFTGKKRMFQIAVQGRVKRRVRVSSLCTGIEFHATLKDNPAAEWIAQQMLRAAARVFSKTSTVDAHGDRPYFLNPVVAACQIVNVAKAGEEPDLMSAQDDCRLWSPDLADKDGNPIDSEKRREWCDNPSHLEGMYFEPDEYVYTFHIWQHLVCYGTYRATVASFVSWDLTWTLTSEPLMLMAKDKDSGDYVYSMLVWHERLLYPKEHEEREQELKVALKAAAKKAREEGGNAAGRLADGVRALMFWK